MIPKDGLIKSSDLPSSVKSDTKVKLNRRGNELFNSGDTEGARRIFQTTGYSDGLIRVGEKYLSENRQLDALKMFKLAKDDKRSEVLIVKLADIISTMIGEGSDGSL